MTPQTKPTIMLSSHPNFIKKRYLLVQITPILMDLLSIDANRKWHYEQ